MNSGYMNSTNDLDHIRRARGIEACKNTFRGLKRDYPQNAIRLINDTGLSFSTFFLLRPEVKELQMEQDLSRRNRLALLVCENVKRKKGGKAAENPISLEDEATRDTLLWIFESGVPDDGIDDEFDHILDISASVLIKVHHEKSIYPIMVELIFKRNRKESYYHDLIWALFQSHDPKALRDLVRYLRSPYKKDVELARTLLSISEDTPLNTSLDKQRQYASYLSWLNENEPYLYFTDESFQLTNAPSPCAVDLEAKFLCKKGSPKERKAKLSLTDTELGYLDNFKHAGDDEKPVLAKYSQKLHKEDPANWDKWMQYPVSKQVQIAKLGREEFV